MASFTCVAARSDPGCLGQALVAHAWCARSMIRGVAGRITIRTARAKKADRGPGGLFSATFLPTPSFSSDSNDCIRHPVCFIGAWLVLNPFFGMARPWAACLAGDPAGRYSRHRRRQPWCPPSPLLLPTLIADLWYLLQTAYSASISPTLSQRKTPDETMLNIRSLYTAIASLLTPAQCAGPLSPSHGGDIIVNLSNDVARWNPAIATTGRTGR